MQTFSHYFNVFTAQCQAGNIYKSALKQSTTTVNTDEISFAARPIKQ